jgi:hypothetical protein
MGPTFFFFKYMGGPLVIVLRPRLHFDVVPTDPIADDFRWPLSGIPDGINDPSRKKTPEGRHCCGGTTP